MPKDPSLEKTKQKTKQKAKTQIVINPCSLDKITILLSRNILPIECCLVHCLTSFRSLFSPTAVEKLIP